MSDYKNIIAPIRNIRRNGSKLYIFIDSRFNITEAKKRLHVGFITKRILYPFRIRELNLEENSDYLVISIPDLKTHPIISIKFFVTIGVGQNCISKKFAVN